MRGGKTVTQTHQKARGAPRCQKNEYLFAGDPSQFELFKRSAPRPNAPSRVSSSTQRRKMTPPHNSTTTTKVESKMGKARQKKLNARTVRHQHTQQITSCTGTPKQK